MEYQKNIQQNHMDKDDIGDDEILYTINKRNWTYLWCGDIIPFGLLFFISYCTLFKTTNASILAICIGIILFIVSSYFLSIALTFNELTIYEDRVVIDRFFLKIKL
jgi:hypothetical protein